MSEETDSQIIHQAIQRAVDILSEHIDSGVIICTSVEAMGTIKWAKPWGNGFAVTEAIKQEARERKAVRKMEIREAMGYYCTEPDED